MTARAFFGRSRAPLAVSAPSIAAFAVNNPPGNQSATVSGASTATASGGTPPYTFAWTRQSFSGPPAIRDDTTTARLIVSVTSTPFSYTSVERVTVTDALGATASFDIPVSLNLESGL